MSTKPMISLRPHQIRGVDAMSKHNKGQLIKPTGAGKRKLLDLVLQSTGKKKESELKNRYTGPDK